MTQLTPYLSFNGNCNEAMEFYKSCLGEELEVSLVKDSPMAAQMPGKENSVTLTIHGGSVAEIKELFNKLKEGGKVTHEIETTFLGPTVILPINMVFFGLSSLTKRQSKTLPNFPLLINGRGLRWKWFMHTPLHELIYFAYEPAEIIDYLKTNLS